MTTDNRYFLDLAVAFVRGVALQTGVPALDDNLLTTPIGLLTDKKKHEIINVGSECGLKLYRFKRGHADMSRVRQTIGVLQGVMPQSILDVGSGRGAFLWPCLDAFLNVPITAIEVDERRVELYKTVKRGGIERLNGVHCDIQHPPSEFLKQQFDVVTMLEVLEHLPDPRVALNNVVRLAQRHVIISVPSKEDDNPAHIHLFTEKSLSEMLGGIDGIKSFRYDYVLGHLFAFLTIQK